MSPPTPNQPTQEAGERQRYSSPIVNKQDVLSRKSIPEDGSLQSQRRGREKAAEVSLQDVSDGPPRGPPTPCGPPTPPIHKRLKGVRAGEHFRSHDCFLDSPQREVVVLENCCCWQDYKRRQRKKFFRKSPSLTGSHESLYR